MRNTLFGLIPDNSDLAKKIVAKGINEPFYELDLYDTPLSVSFNLYHNNKRVEPTPLYRSGIYCIYREKTECLYVGFSGNDKNGMRSRIERFFKHLAGKSRHDEYHTGAQKAYDDGVRIEDNFYVKIMPVYQFPEMPEEGDYELKNIDEYVAFLLESKYNTHIRIVR